MRRGFATERLSTQSMWERAIPLRAAEVPIVRELCEAGYDVNSVWDLVNTSEPYPNALNVLLRHLQIGGYPDRVMESLGRALAVEPAAYMWNQLCALFERAEGAGEKEGLAVALAAAATPEHLDQMIGLLHNPSLGRMRVHLLRAIKRVGGKTGRDVLKSLGSDDILGREARALLRQPTSKQS
jgi:hypothetical protein